MSDPRLQRAKDLFEQALDLPSEEQKSFLDRACQGDAELEKEVRSLLRAHQHAGDFLRSGQVAPALADMDARSPDPLAGSSIGSYKVLGLIDRGGMGAVYRAEQESPRREVAIKLVDRMIVTKELLRRFEVEAQVLARLHHPGIAHIYEAGTTGEELGGRPYFAMELIDGLPITTFADKHRLSRNQRLDLMSKVCEAVQHAHRVGVIHRDLKPANILVTSDGQPKILDFGVARSVDTDLQVTTMMSSQAGLVGTLPYMSPEQVRGDPNELDTRADVYALGVLCYELLTGEHPRDIKGKTLTDAIRIIVEEEPETLGGVTKARFPADLETIVGTALAGEKERRYGSASDLAGDIRRFLDGQPINARPQGAVYQLRKLILRNRLASSLLAGIVIISLGFAVVMGLQARSIALERDRANLEAETATKVSDFVEELFKSVDPMQEKASAWTAREFLDRGAEKIGNELQDQPSVRARMLVLIGEAYSNMGLGDHAEALVREAVEIGRELGNTAANANLDHALLLAARLSNDEGETEQAIALCREAVSLSAEAYGTESPQYATSLNHLGAYLRFNNEMDEAREAVEQALALNSRLSGPESLEVGDCKRQLGWLFYYSGEYEKARKQFAEVCEINEKLLPPEHPGIATCYRDQTTTLVALKEFDAAARLTQKELELLQASLGPDSMAVGSVLNNLGYLKYQDGEFEEARRYYSEAVATYRRVGGPEHRRILRGLHGVALAAHEMNDIAGAIAATRERLELAQKHHSADTDLIEKIREDLAWYRDRMSGKKQSP